MPYRLVLVDGYSILYRAFYGIPALTSSQGVPTNAVFGFATTLFRLMEDPETTSLVVAFDAPARTFRHHADSSYKAHRPQTPDELSSQIPLTRDLVDALHLPMLMVPGVEADDVIGTAARRAAGCGWNVRIVTGDNDACQLVDPQIQVLWAGRGTELTLMDEDAVREKFGVQPSQLPDWKALCGDASDNIPGVAGIGPRTAASLLSRFGSLPELYGRLEEVSSERVRAMLEKSRDRALLSLHLATIRTDVEIAVEPEQWKLPALDIPRLQEFCTRLGFRSILRRLGAGKSLQPEGAAAADYGSVTAAELPGFLASHADPSRLRPLAIHLAEGDESGPAMAVSPHAGVARWLPPSETAAARAILEDASIPKCVHDLKAAAHLCGAAGIALRGAVVDTSIASYLLNPGRGHHRLDEVAFETLEIELQPQKERGRAGDSNENEDGGASPGERLCLAADCVGQMEWPLMERLGREEMLPVFNRIEMPLAPILAEMEQVGVAIDFDLLDALSQEMGRQIERLAGEIYEAAGLKFSINSPRQLQEVLFRKLNLGSGRGNRSTDAETLKALAPLHPLPGKVLQYRELSKLKSTYADAIPRLASPDTGRVHTSLNQTVTATGRLSSSEPNLQNIPVRTAIGREIRRAFIAEPGRVLLSVDYSQIELRLLAHMAGDPELTRAFRMGEDVHAHTAASLFDVPPAEVTPQMRRRAKSINFGLMYGMSAYGLASDLGMSRAEAESYIQQYFRRFPAIKQFIAETVTRVQRQGYAITLFGRRRYLPEISSRNHTFRQAAERAAVNTPIQGTAADMMKLAMIRVHEETRRQAPGAQMILQVHDELVLELPPEDAPGVAALVRSAMEEVIALDVPLTVDVRVGTNWGEMAPLSPELALSPAG